VGLEINVISRPRTLKRAAAEYVRALTEPRQALNQRSPGEDQNVWRRAMSEPPTNQPDSEASTSDRAIRSRTHDSQSCDVRQDTTSDRS
jgi:hypothetical protein